jgi:hypothetical protein
MSKKKHTDKKTHWQGEKNTQHWAGRIDREILEAIKAHAKATRRTIGGQINVALDEWLRQYKGPHDSTAVQYPPTPVLPSGGSQPPRRIQEQSHARKTALPAPPKLKEIAESDEGWEGTDLNTLTGTKVTV